MKSNVINLLLKFMLVFKKKVNKKYKLFLFVIKKSSACQI